MANFYHIIRERDIVDQHTFGVIRANGKRIAEQMNIVNDRVGARVVLNAIHFGHIRKIVHIVSSEKRTGNFIGGKNIVIIMGWP